MDFISACYTFIYAFNSYLAIPSIIIFLGTGIILTLKTYFPQIRLVKKFWSLITSKIEKSKTKAKTITPYQALFTAMATTIGMGNVVGPSVAISVGGPGALFWLILYIFFGSVIKFVEVTFAVYSRVITKQGDITGGPTQYLGLISPILGNWYAAITILLFTGWSSIQVNTISCICYLEGIPKWVSGLIAVSILLAVVLGGVKRIGNVTSKLVPIMFILYVSFTLIILFQNHNLLIESIKLVFKCAFNPSAICGGAAGITLFTAIREGIFKSIFITESGLGTSSIAQSLSDVEQPVDQGILAMFSGVADIVLCSLSGLLTLVTGVWTAGKLNNTLVYEAFKIYSPIAGGQIILIASVFLFVITSLIGNTFNGSQSFAFFTKHKYMKIYFIISAIIAFSGSLAATPFLWNLMDIGLVLVAVPNLIGLLILAFRYSKIIKA